VREVLLRLSDHKDLQRAGEAWGVMQQVCNEERIWRELCYYHFTAAQLSKTLEEIGTTEEAANWQQLYHKLRRYVDLTCFKIL
jgi:F-box protein 25/32